MAHDFLQSCRSFHFIALQLTDHGIAFHYLYIQYQHILQHIGREYEPCRCPEKVVMQVPQHQKSRHNMHNRHQRHDAASSQPPVGSLLDESLGYLVPDQHGDHDQCDCPELEGRKLKRIDHHEEQIQDQKKNQDQPPVLSELFRKKCGPRTHTGGHVIRRHPGTHIQGSAENGHSRQKIGNQQAENIGIQAVQPKQQRMVGRRPKGIMPHAPPPFLFFREHSRLYHSRQSHAISGKALNI